jgi:hypothetical protein
VSALSAAEKAKLNALHEQVEAQPWDSMAAGRALADQLRRQMPDIDDVSLGRVAMATAVYLNEVLATAGDGPVDTALFNLTCDQIMCAGLDLTASEWQEAKL